METAVKLKRCVTNTNVFYIIISKFSHKKKFGLIILFVINKNLEINLYCIVLPLGLAINLWAKSNRKPLFNLKEIT